MLESQAFAIVHGMAETPSIGERIKFMRSNVLGLKSQQELADRLGVTRGAVGNWERGEGIKTNNLRKIAQQFGVSFEWLATGEGSPTQTTPIRRNDRVERIPDLAIHGGMGNGGFSSVKLNDAGAYENPDDVRGFWTFPDYMLRQLTNLKSIYAWEARGDSMEPTLPGGSVVFVDTSQTALPPEDIYALNYGDGLMVKRLKLVPRSEFIDVISDNERYGSDRLRREEVEIYGRVVGWFQWRG